MEQKPTVNVPLKLLGGTYHQGAYEQSSEFFEDIMTSERFPRLCRAVGTCDIAAPFPIGEGPREAFITLMPPRTVSDLDDETQEAIAEMNAETEDQDPEY